MADAPEVSAPLPGGTSAARRSAPRTVLAVHACAVIAVLATAGWGRLPFVPMYSLLDNRPTWSGLATSWVLVALVYVVLWYLASRGSRWAELALFIALVLESLWAAMFLLITLLQGVGISPSDLRFSAVWWLRALVAAVTAVALWCATRMRSGGATDESAGTGGSSDTDEPDDALGRHDGIPLPAPLPVFGAAALVVCALGLALNAWMLAVLAPSTATSGEAVAAVRAAVGRPRTASVISFQDSVNAAIDTMAQTRTRDRWRIIDDIIDTGVAPRYTRDITWPIQVGYRNRLACVAVRAGDTSLTVFEGVCPR